MSFSWLWFKCKVFRYIGKISWVVEWGETPFNEEPFRSGLLITTLYATGTIPAFRMRDAKLRVKGLQEGSQVSNLKASVWIEN